MYNYVMKYHFYKPQKTQLVDQMLTDDNLSDHLKKMEPAIINVEYQTTRAKYGYVHLTTKQMLANDIIVKLNATIEDAISQIRNMNKDNAAWLEIIDKLHLVKQNDLESYLSNTLLIPFKKVFRFTRAAHVYDLPADQIEAEFNQQITIIKHALVQEFKAHANIKSFTIIPTDEYSRFTVNVLLDLPNDYNNVEVEDALKPLLGGDFERQVALPNGRLRIQGCSYVESPTYWDGLW